jgi:peroxiredoxin
MMSKKSSAFLLMALIAVAIVAVIGSRFPRQAATAADAKGVEEPLAGIKPFEIPEGELKELFEFADDLLETEKEFETDEEQREYQLRTMATHLAVAEQILKQKDLSDDDAEHAALLKTQGLVNLAMLGVPKAAETAIASIAAMKDDSRSIVADFAKNNERKVKIICVAGLGDKARDELIAEVLAELKKRKYPQRLLQQAQMLGESLGEIDDRDRFINFYTTLAAGMKDSGIEALEEQAKRLEGQLRRVQLPGQTLELSGTTVDGKKFDWEKYRGKVVLVDFWATWCGPCLKELPNIKKAYRKYHSRGFEVVGISLDDEQEGLEAFLEKNKIPWVTLFEPDEFARGWEHPMAVHYGVSAIPTAFLVDQEGKVVSLAVYGPELQEHLEKLLGDKE